MKELLYHYTTGTGLLGMLKDFTQEEPNIKLWASHYMYMNDPEEYKLGEKICVDIIDKVESDLGVPEAYRMRKCAENPTYRNVIDRFERTSVGQSMCPYLISLSRACDTLHMWNMYASNGNGLALGFNRRKLLEAGIPLKDCMYYDEKAEDVIQKIEQEIKELYQELDKDRPLKDAIQDHNKDTKSLFFRWHYIFKLICVFFGIRIKTKAYELEEESRITPRPNSKILFRERNGIIIPYMEYHIPFNCVEKIIVGPTADFTRVRESILILLNYKGIEWDGTKIEKSKVPFRN